MFISVLTEILSNYSGVENSHGVSTGFPLVVSQHLLAKEVGIWMETLQEMLLFVCLFPFCDEPGCGREEGLLCYDSVWQESACKTQRSTTNAFGHTVITYGNPHVGR